MLGLFKLVKLTINAYATEDRSEPKLGTFQAQFNPESYSLRYQSKFNAGQGINTQGRQLSYMLSPPQVLSLRLIMDSTGAVKAKGSAQAQVSSLLQTAYQMNGSTHEPSYLRLTWGKNLAFNCRLTSADVRYTIFARDGTPLRAEVEATFEGDMEDPTGSRVKNSPDLSHLRVVKAGDQLPLLCQEIYGTTAHCAMVARANRLNSLRSLTPGQRLIFPPLT